MLICRGRSWSGLTSLGEMLCISLSTMRIYTLLVVVIVLALNPVVLMLLSPFISFLNHSNSGAGFSESDFYALALRRFGLPSSPPKVAVLVVETMVMEDLICDGSCAVERSLTSAEMHQGSRAAERVLAWADARGMCRLYVKIAAEGCFSERYGSAHPSWCTLLELPKLDSFCGGVDAALVVNVSAGVLGLPTTLPLRSVMANGVTVFDNATKAQVFRMKDSPCKLFASANKRALRAPLFNYYLHNTTFVQGDFSQAITPPVKSDFAKIQTRDAPILRFWTKNFCNPMADWNHALPVTYKALVTSSERNRKQKENLKKEKKKKKTCAVVFYVLEGEPGRGEKFLRLLDTLVRAIPATKAAVPQCDLVIAAAPLDTWADPNRTEALKRMIQRLEEAQVAVEFRMPETMVEADFSDRAIRVLSEGQNCCGWTEYQKLGTWNLLEYDSVLVLDSDVKLSSDLNELFGNTDYDFLATPDAVCALNGGFLWLRPNHTTYLEMKNAVQSFDFSRRFGWSKSGPLLPLLPSFSTMRGPYRRMTRNTPPYAIAEETNQGFLFWFFFVQGQQGGPKYRAAMLDQCVYNFNMQRGLVRFLCSEHATNNEIQVRACHKGCDWRSTLYSLTTLKFVVRRPSVTSKG